MINIEYGAIRLRAIEPIDLEIMYQWENDPNVWGVSGTLAPFSRHIIEQFIEQQRDDIYQNRQLRLVIETTNGEAVGFLDLFEFDPQNHRAGVGILIYDTANRGRGYAKDSLLALDRYAEQTLQLKQLWCNVPQDNHASIALFNSAGYSTIGTKRDWLYRRDGYVDEIMMQKLLF